MAYQVEVGEKAARRLSRLPAKHRRQVLRRITDLRLDPRPPQSAKLQVLNGCRLRCSEYRILYTVDDGASLIRVYLIMQRGEGYPE